jgi:hypothetical protein
MLLRLKYDTTSLRAACAVYIRGGSPSVWLVEIGQLGIPVERIDCYVVPVSVSSISAAGLFVIIRGDIPLLPPHLPTYALLSDRLYLPVEAVIYPPIADDELRKILLWEVQFFHPTIGMVGFEKADRIDLHSLVAHSEPHQQRWDMAHRGLASLPTLDRISVEALDDDIMSLFEKELDKKPLSEIPKSPNDKSGALDKIKRDAAYHVLKGMQNIRKGLGEFFKDDGSRAAGAGSGDGSLGIFTPIFALLGLVLYPISAAAGKANDWLEKNLEQLEKERNEEIKRLLNMLDEDPAEALKYAIPLASFHEQRGQAPQGSTLMPRNTNFDLRGLGGGRSADSWNIGSHYADLRAKYLRAAEKEIKNGNFKRAAYIYAHLLADFNMAANVLVQGKMYREAAALYKDHLKNIPAAAECLEKGGLLNEAIDLYLLLGQEEKVADLYKQLDREDAAEKYYAVAAEKHYDAKNYLEAARVYEDKMNLNVKASAALLSGWGSGVQAEDCLKRYFSLVSQKAPDGLVKSIQGIYENNTRLHMRKALLNTLTHVNKMSGEEEVHRTTTTIAYEIISDQISTGDTSCLFMLSTFVNKDKMLHSDLSRFAYKTRNTTKVRFKKLEGFQLSEKVDWRMVSYHNNNLYAIGYQNHRMFFARANWYGNVEYELFTQFALDTNLHLLSSPYERSKVMIMCRGEHPYTQQRMKASKYFDDFLTIDFPNWISKEALGVTINDASKVAVLEYLDGALVLSEYSLDGALERSVDCTVNSDAIGGVPSFSGLPQMVYRHGYYFIILLGGIMAISKEGKAILEFLGDAQIKGFVASERLDQAEFLLAAQDDIYHVSLLSGTETMQNGNAGKAEFNMYRLGIPTPVILSGMLFLPESRIAIASDMSVEIFNIKTGYGESEAKFQTKEKIIGIVPTNIRNSCAALLKSGRVEIFEWDQV